MQKICTEYPNNNLSLLALKVDIMNRFKMETEVLLQQLETY